MYDTLSQGTQNDNKTHGMHATPAEQFRRRRRHNTNATLGCTNGVENIFGYFLSVCGAPSIRTCWAQKYPVCRSVSRQRDRSSGLFRVLASATLGSKIDQAKAFEHRRPQPSWKISLKRKLSSTDYCCTRYNATLSNKIAQSNALEYWLLYCNPLRQQNRLC